MYYKAAQDGTNKCAVDRGGCQQLCLPSLESVMCKCAIGYKPLEATSSRCVGVDEFLLYSLGYEIKGIMLDGENSSEDVSEKLFPKHFQPTTQQQLNGTKLSFYIIFKGQEGEGL